MNYRCAWVALWALCASVMVRAEKGPVDLLEADFAGAEALRQNTNLVTLQEVMGLTESAAMVDTILQRSGASGLSAWTGFAPADLSLVMREALEHRCRLLVTGPTNAPLFALAVRFPSDVSAAWKEGGAIYTNELTQASKKGSWVVIQSKTGQTNLSGWIEKVTTDTNEATALLTLSANLDQWPSGVKPGLMPNLSGVQLTSTARGDGVRSAATLRFATNLNLRLSSWSIPTNSIHDPLVAFSAAQDPAAWLDGADLLKRFALTKAPAQGYLWSVSLSPFMFNGAVTSADPIAQMDVTAHALADRYNSGTEKPLFGQLEYDTNLHRMSWIGLPIAMPHLMVAPDPGYLTFGLFPVTGKLKPAPAELFEQIIGRTNLVYYDWEITQGRMQQLRTVTQLQSIIARGGLHTTNAVSERWLEAIEPRLGNAVAELTLSRTNEMSLVRRSPIGLDAMELVGLARWAEPFPSGPKHTKRAAAPLPPATIPPPAPGLPPSEVKPPQ